MRMLCCFMTGFRAPVLLARSLRVIARLIDLDRTSLAYIARTTSIIYDALTLHPHNHNIVGIIWIRTTACEPKYYDANIYIYKEYHLMDSSKTKISSYYNNNSSTL